MRGSKRTSSQSIRQGQDVDTEEDMKYRDELSWRERQTSSSGERFHTDESKGVLKAKREEKAITIV